MSLDQHVAILTHHSLAAATPNKLKAGNPLEFYGLIAFPPAAINDLGAIALAASKGAPLANFEIGISTNAQSKKPIPGIPGDWYVVRASTQFAPYVADAAGNQLEQGDPAGQQAIRSTFYAGKKVRVMLSAYQWHFKGKDGISFNLSGVMDAGEQGERLAIGNGEVVNAFAKHANPNAAPAAGPFAQPQQEQAAPTAQGNPFGAQPTQAAAPTAGANPFAQSAPAAAGNPFAAA